jgi:hypothetical protein
MNKIDLELKIEGLKKAIAEHKDFTGTYESQLKTAEQDLKDIDKPELTSSQMDDIYEAVETGIGEFDFSDTDNFDIEYGIDYDGKVHCESHEFNEADELCSLIINKLCGLFKEVEDDNSQLNTQTVAEKII